jgi:hypothetical protein
MSKLTTQKLNWLIYAENIKKNDKQTFLSTFGEVKGKGLNQPKKRTRYFMQLYQFLTMSTLKEMDPPFL